MLYPNDKRTFEIGQIWNKNFLFCGEEEYFRRRVAQMLQKKHRIFKLFGIKKT